MSSVRDRVLHSTKGQSSIPRSERGEESGHKAKRGIKNQYRESAMPDRFWMDIEATSVKAYGRDTGQDVVRAMRVAEHDFVFASEVLLGIKALVWQQMVWENGLERKPYATVQASNAGGKTTSFCMFYFVAGTFRKWAPEWWDTYEMLHHGPLESHALQVRLKMSQILAGHAREQAYKVKGGYAYRPCLLEPFIHEATADEGKHQAYEWFDGWSNLIFRSTAYKGKGSDGSAPHFIGEDELRYENNLTHLVEFVYLPRFIRAPGGRLYLPITFLEASVEAVTLHQRGKEGDQDWSAFDIDITANDTLDEESKDRASRNLSKRARAQVLGGKAIQPMGAKFSAASVAASFLSAKEPEWLDDLEGARERAERRCKLCLERRDNKRDQWGKAAAEHDIHLIVAAIDPASSAGYDAIPAAAWDMEPYGDPHKGAEVIYIEELEPGTRIQEVARHMVKMGRLLRCEVGFDRKGPLGHAVKDQLVELDPDGEYVELATDTGEMKDEWLDFFGALMDGGWWRSPHHQATRSQITNYVRKDAKIPTDFLMVQVLCAQVAKPYFPDLLSAPTTGEGATEEGSSGYDGLVGGDVLMEGLDPYAGLGLEAHVSSARDGVAA